MGTRNRGGRKTNIAKTKGKKKQNKLGGLNNEEKQKHINGPPAHFSHPFIDTNFPSPDFNQHSVSRVSEQPTRKTKKRGFREGARADRGGVFSSGQAKGAPGPGRCSSSVPETPLDNYFFWKVLVKNKKNEPGARWDTPRGKPGEKKQVSIRPGARGGVIFPKRGGGAGDGGVD